MRLFTVFALLLVLNACSNPESEKNKQTLPYLGHREPVTQIIDGKEVTDTLYQQIPDFEFLNQDSVFISQEFFESGLYVANFFFTHCPSICPTMQRNLLEVYQKFHDDSRLKFLSHSIDFKNDSPSVLKEYANKLGVDNDQWQFVSGDKKDIYGMADHYMVYAKEDENVAGGYDHSGYTLLIDKNRNIRGAYDGTSKEEIQKLIQDLEIILKDY